jgi:hypothetical protein
LDCRKLFQNNLAPRQSYSVFCTGHVVEKIA